MAVPCVSWPHFQLGTQSSPTRSSPPWRQGAAGGNTIRGDRPLGSAGPQGPLVLLPRTEHQLLLPCPLLAVPDVDRCPQEVLFLLSSFSAIYPCFTQSARSPRNCRPSLLVPSSRPPYLLASVSTRLPSPTSIGLRKGLPPDPLAPGVVLFCFLGGLALGSTCSSLSPCPPPPLQWATQPRRFHLLNNHLNCFLPPSPLSPSFVEAPSHFLPEANDSLLICSLRQSNKLRTTQKEPFQCES